MNIVCLAGNLGMDPELKHTQGGTSVLRMRLATSERRKKGDQWEDHTEWHTVIVFGNRAEGLSKILSKGSKIAVTGKLTHRQWEDKDGNKRNSTEILANDVTLQGERRGGGQRQERPAETGGGYGDGPAHDFGDDSIPFLPVDGRLA
jgi:single-strand DNA-binding protein